MGDGNGFSNPQSGWKYEGAFTVLLVEESLVMKSLPECITHEENMVFVPNGRVEQADSETIMFCCDNHYFGWHQSFLIEIKDWRGDLIWRKQTNSRNGE